MDKCIIIANTYKDDAKPIASTIAEVLSKHDVKASILLFSGEDQEIAFKDYSFAITLGGDGTVLYAARKCATFGIPVFPINLGEFGFRAGLSKSSSDEPFILFLDNTISKIVSVSSR